MRLLKAGDAPLPKATVTWTFDRALEKKSHGTPNGLLQTFQDISDRAKPGWKSFPFMRLPAELRNKVYEEYLDDERIVWRNCMNPPPLCMVSHQICAEVLPMWGSLAYSVVSFRERDNTVFSKRNRWMRLMPRGAFISSVLFFPHTEFGRPPPPSHRAMGL